MATPVRINQVNQVIRHPRTTFEVVTVNVNRISASADTRELIPNCRTNLLALFFLFAASGSIEFLLLSLYTLAFRINFSNYLS